jgi:NADPH:quinone reductase-like Zn-dependent oxidoreductase
VVPVAASATAATLERLADNQASGHTSVNVQRIYPLEGAPEALADFASGTLGKLVIVI